MSERQVQFCNQISGANPLTIDIMFVSAVSIKFKIAHKLTRKRLQDSICTESKAWIHCELWDKSLYLEFAKINNEFEPGNDNCMNAHNVLSFMNLCRLFDQSG